MNRELANLVERVYISARELITGTPEWLRVYLKDHPEEDATPPRDIGPMTHDEFRNGIDIGQRYAHTKDQRGYVYRIPAHEFGPLVQYVQKQHQAKLVRVRLSGTTYRALRPTGEAAHTSIFDDFLCFGVVELQLIDDTKIWVTITNLSEAL